MRAPQSSSLRHSSGDTHIDMSEKDCMICWYMDKKCSVATRLLLLHLVCPVSLQSFARPRGRNQGD